MAASLDNEQRIWVSLLAGRPGFAHAESPEVVRINTDQMVSADNDVFWANVTSHPVAGLLFIELSSRRRLKINGSVSFDPGNSALVLHVQECFPLCPRYIQRREVEVTTLPEKANRPSLTGTSFTPEMHEWIGAADTLFVGSAHDDNHLDVGHRGGNPGFVQILDPHTLLIPDYNGNSMFNTLGNFSVNPRAALLFVNFETGETLQLSGHADIHFTESRTDDFTGGTGRYWKFNLDSWIQQAGPSGLTWTFLEYSRFNV